MRLLFSFLLLSPFWAFGQFPTSVTPQDTSSNRIEIIKSDRGIFEVIDGREVRYLAGKVRLKHKDAFLLCDSAVVEDQYVFAYKDVVIIQDDTVNIFADSLIYDGFYRTADLYGDVILKHGKKKLFTKHLEYNMATKVATYNTRATLANESTRLSSNRGSYFVGTSDAFFKDSVTVTDPQFNIKTDTLRFNTGTNTAFFVAPTVIKQDSALIYTEAGFYDTDRDVAEFTLNPQYQRNEQRARADTMRYNGATKIVTLHGNAWSEDGTKKARANTIRYDSGNDLMWLEGNAHYEDNGQNVDSDTIRYDNKRKTFATRGRSLISDPPQLIEADIIDYDSNTGSGNASGNVFWQDTAADLTVRCAYADYDKSRDFLKAHGDRPLLSTLLEGDTLWVRADTLVALRENPADSARTLLGYHDVRIFSTDFQGKCDSFSYAGRDSVFRLYQSPILWADTSQFVADTINILTVGNKVDRILLQQDAFVINSPDAKYFNQIKGRQITAFFVSDTLRSTQVVGNAESVYYALDDGQAYIGVNQVQCSEMLLQFEANQVTGIRFYTEPQSTLTPMLQAKHDALRLKGFRWDYDKRPRSKADL